ncbi:MAG: DUF1616 domain-containing protein [Chloroflexi bacterium]|nr:DUF1616 domain-containing protein [Chloroflexota bacterium]MCL5025991.1 DUF1616 domain-containing protein [Chloroflexota bacterium]
MLRRSYDLLAVVAITGAAVTLSFLSPGSAIQVAIALPLVLVIPGYVLMAAMFPKTMVGTAERLVSTLGLSLATVIVCGLVLNWTPWGLMADAWSLLLGVLSIGGSAFAFARRHSDTSFGNGRMRIGLTPRDGVLLTLAALTTLGAGLTAYYGAIEQSIPGYTQLWILPAEGGEETVIRLGVMSYEEGPTRYRLQVLMGGAVASEWAPIDISPGEKWEAVVRIPAASSRPGEVEAVLYLWNDPTRVYRRVALWHGDVRK